MNLYEDEQDPEAIRTAYSQIFRTETGKALCRLSYFAEETE